MWPGTLGGGRTQHQMLASCLIRASNLSWSAAVVKPPKAPSMLEKCSTLVRSGSKALIRSSDLRPGGRATSELESARFF